MFRILVRMSVLATLHLSTTQGAVVLSESFTYPDGVAQTVSAEKWVGHSGPTNQVDVSRGALNLTGSEGQDINALLAGQPYSTTNSDRLYASFKVRFTQLPSSSGSYFAHFKDSSAGFRARIWALTTGSSSGTFRLGISSASGSAPALEHPMELKLTTEYVVVTRLAVSNSVSTLWINPSSELSTSVSTEAGAGIAITSYAFRQASGIGTLAVDDLLVGTLFSDVITTTNPAPTITSQPQNLTALAGANVMFSVSANGAEPLAYQWRFNDTEISGATQSTLSLTNVALRDQGDYRVVVRNFFGTATSQAAALTVTSLDPPSITKQPLSLQVKAGENARFEVVAAGTTPMTFQWQLNEIDLSGANSSTLLLTNLAASQAGRYRVNVRNSLGSVQSEVALLTVDPPVPSVATNSVIVVQAPAIKLTNFLENLICPGDLPTNSFSELVLRPGEKLTTRVFVSDLAGTNLSVSLGSGDVPPTANWTIVENNGTNAVGLFTFEPTQLQAGTNYTVVAQAIGAGGTNRVAWSIYVPNATEQKIIVSEFLANPTTSTNAAHFNPLHRSEPAPSPSSQDEFVELVNMSAADLDLKDWTLADSVQARFRFKDSFTLLSSNAVVIYGGPTNGFPPLLDVPAFPANESAFGLGLNNSGGDFIVLRNPASNLVMRVAYSELSSTGSLTRYPNLNGGFVAHASVSTNHASPGRTSTGELWKKPEPNGTNVTETSQTLPAATEAEATQPPVTEPEPAKPVAESTTATTPSPFPLSVTFEPPARLLLRWIAEPGKIYTVFYAADPAGPFVPMTTELSFTDAHGWYVDQHWATRTAGFYRISVP